MDDVEGELNRGVTGSEIGGVTGGVQLENLVIGSLARIVNSSSSSQSAANIASAVKGGLDL